MSTFNGIIREFPEIRVDFFRKHPDIQPPLACFLSHIHSDHLAGLETLKSPFVYCSPATRELLLRLERYPCRINYVKGIIEARTQHYKHLKGLLKAIPLETPTVLELEPGNHVQVTLFDANHCPGAVMFLFESSGNSVLYTGDIRSEPWFVTSIARNPCMIEYSSGIKTLDMIYLDTSFTEDVSFQTKAEGIRELVNKVSRYPPDTVFHLQAWTFGYEDVWVALSKALNSQIHVDKYKMRLYKSLVKPSANEADPPAYLSAEAARLVGFKCGNAQHPGCLTSNEHVRLHSCEKGTPCHTMQNANVVWLKPVIARLSDGQTLTEIGVGGGGDDLEKEAELEYLDPAEIQNLFEMIRANDSITEDVKARMQSFLLQAVTNGRNISLDIDISSFDAQNETDLTNAIESIAHKSRLGTGKEITETPELLSRKVRFPYSRHSSYPELCELVNVFKPKDVWPCTVSPVEWLVDGVDIASLFGQYCSGNSFLHDITMRKLASKQQVLEQNHESQATTASDMQDMSSQYSLSAVQSQGIKNASQLELAVNETTTVVIQSQSSTISEVPATPKAQTRGPNKLDHPSNSFDSQSSASSDVDLELRRQAFKTMIENMTTDNWQPIGLLSTTDNHTHSEQELGNG